MTFNCLNIFAIIIIISLSGEINYIMLVVSNLFCCAIYRKLVDIRLYMTMKVILDEILNFFFFYWLGCLKLIYFNTNVNYKLKIAMFIFKMVTGQVSLMIWEVVHIVLTVTELVIKRVW